MKKVKYVISKEKKEENKKIMSEDLEYIKKFSNIKVSKICRDLGIDHGNLCNGRVINEKEHKVKKRIEHELASLYLEDYE